MIYFAEKESAAQWSFPDSFWWGLMVLTTVGYGERAPDTMVGQVGVVVEVVEVVEVEVLVLVVEVVLMEVVVVVALVVGGDGRGARLKCSNLQPKLCNEKEQKLPSKPQYWFS